MEIIFEDDDYIVLNKEAGVLSIPGRFSADSTSLYALLKQKYGKIFIVHRLDKETSGVICFAKNKEAHRELNLQFTQGQVKKTYLALVRGKPELSEGTIDYPLKENPQRLGTMMVDPKYRKNAKDFVPRKPAVTDYKVIESFRNYSLVEVSPRTGKTHQIRAHFREIGHPLAVDQIYGKRGELFLSQIKPDYKKSQNEKERPLISRITLHAARLSFYHFHKKEQLEFNSPLPKDFSLLLKQLRKHG